ncbi:PQ-loop domain-containing transporter [uncultured Nevskia sp.]|uniref:PQ-loop domain-containing transporter n=1 Tax=uncultured Nevskia sp. TaxID=228950 RepID=UPI0025DF9561|nr:PQ-loop domain-containing transporter [uncultured Nevskia sp.]
MTEAIGWIASVILLVTMMRQVWTQWRDRATGGVSHWLFVGQIAASLGFTVYSALLENAVFVVTNALMLVNALVGLYLDRRNRRLNDES